MAAQPPAPEIQALIERAGRARAALGESLDSIQDKFHPKSLMAGSVRSHPGRWIAGAAATGLLTSRLLFRRRPKALPVKKSHPMLFFILRTISNVVAPAVKIWLFSQIKDYLARRAQGATKPFPY